MKGGSLKPQEIKDFLEASYITNPDPFIGDYQLDSKLSNEYAKVYYNPKTKQAIVVHRGTSGLLDWGNNLAYALGAYELTDRYKQGKKTQEKAEKKYGKQNISTLGHSQGAILSRKLGGDTKEVINVNPAYKFETPLKNEYNIRSSTDVVSGLYAPIAEARKVLMPERAKKRDITIGSENKFDILGEHSYNILDRLDEDQIIGRGIKEIKKNYVIQSVIFKTPLWGQSNAEEWLFKHKLKNKGVDIKKNSLRYRQINPDYIEKKGYEKFITKKLGNGISFIITYKK